MQRKWSFILNLLVPGAGLIALRREWLGVANALLFGVLAEVALLGGLLMPAAISAAVTVSASMAAGAVWLWSQRYWWRRWREAGGNAAFRELALLRDRASEAATTGNLIEAIDFLNAALLINDEDLEANTRLAELFERIAQNGAAAKAWRRVLQLEPDSHRRERIIERLAALKKAS